MLALGFALITACAHKSGPEIMVVEAEVPPPLPPPPIPTDIQTDTPIFLAWEFPPEPIKRVAPDYPAEAVRDSIEGKVILNLIVDEHGDVMEVVVITAAPPDIFNEAAVQAMLQWKFKPAMKDGKPIKVRLAYPIEFRLTERKPPPPPPPPPYPRERAARTESPIFLAWEEPPEPIKRVLPEYPAQAVRDSIEGRVIMNVVINEEGDVIEATVVTAVPPEIFNQAAIAAMMQWKFKPAKQRNHPIKVRLAYPIEFRLKKP